MAKTVQSVPRLTKVRIVDDPEECGTRIFVDGEDISGSTRAFRLTGRAGGVMVLELDRLPDAVEAEGFVELVERGSMRAPVRRCARCDGNHDRVTVSPLGRPCGPFTHWGVCPVTREPILFRFETHPDAPPVSPGATKGATDPDPFAEDPEQWQL